MALRVASGAYLFTLGGAAATLAAWDASAFWWLLATSVLAAVVTMMTDAT